MGPKDDINECEKETKQTYNDSFSDPEFHNDPDRMIFEGELTGKEEDGTK